MRWFIVLTCAVSLVAGGCADPGPGASDATLAPATTVTPVQPSSTTTLPSSSTPESTTASRVPSTTTMLPSVHQLEEGLFCRDLLGRGYSYPEAVQYWLLEGAADRMDAGRNGIPCETVYPHAAVVSYWGDPLPVSVSNQFAFVVGIDPGPPVRIVADYADWLWGEEAEQACREDGQDAECPYEGLYYIRNVNPRLRMFRVANDAKVFLAHPVAADMASVPCVPVSEAVMEDAGFDPHPTHGCEIPSEALPLVWPELVPEAEHGHLVWLIIDGNLVLAIQEQYTP